MPINKKSPQVDPEKTTNKTAVTTQQSSERRGGAGSTTRRHLAAQAAAYKALYYCSGIFTAGRTPDEIDIDISGTSQVFDSLMSKMKAVVDKKNKTVSVKYLPDMPPRIAVWRPVLGTTQLQIGATIDAVKYVPRLAKNTVLPNTDSKPWPQGDRAALAELPAKQKNSGR